MTGGSRADSPLPHPIRARETTVIGDNGSCGVEIFEVYTSLIGLLRVRKHPRCDFGKVQCTEYSVHTETSAESLPAASHQHMHSILDAKEGAA